MAVKLVVAFAAGFASVITPCVLPLVPGYLSAISGVSFAELQEGEGRRPGDPVIVSGKRPIDRIGQQ